MKFTCEFYRNHKQTERRRLKQTFIPMSKWEQVLAKTEGQIIEELTGENAKKRTRRGTYTIRNRRNNKKKCAIKQPRE